MLKKKTIHELQYLQNFWQDLIVRTEHGANLDFFKSKEEEVRKEIEERQKAELLNQTKLF